MSSSSLGTILLEAGVGGQRVVGLRSIWLRSLQLQGETGTGAARQPRGGTLSCSQSSAAAATGSAGWRFRESESGEESAATGEQREAALTMSFWVSVAGFGVLGPVSFVMQAFKNKGSNDRGDKDVCDSQL